MGINRVAGLAWNHLLMRVDNSVGKGTSGMDKLSSVVDGMNMELGSKLFNSLRINTWVLVRLRCVIDVNGATHSQKNGVQSSGSFLKNVAEVLVLFLCSAQLVLRFGILTQRYPHTKFLISMMWMSCRRMLRSLGRCCLEKVSWICWWCCCWGAPCLPQLPPATPKNPLPSILPMLLSCFAEKGATSTASGRLEVNLFLSKKQGGMTIFYREWLSEGTPLT